MTSYQDLDVMLRTLPIYVYDMIVLSWHGIFSPFSLASVDVFECVAYHVSLFYYLLWTPKLLILLYGLHLSWNLRNVEDMYFA